MVHKSGFINIIGNPNVGKSTLTNLFVGKKLSIITPKAQTTRHRILGIVNSDNYQMIISDTPGIIKPAHKLHESMMDFVNMTFEDADILLYLVEYKDYNLKDSTLLKKIKSSKIPLMLVINKIDNIDQIKLESEIDYWKEVLPNAEIWPISAIEKFNIEELKNRIIGGDLTYRITAGPEGTKLVHLYNTPSGKFDFSNIASNNYQVWYWYYDTYPSFPHVISAYLNVLWYHYGVVFQLVLVFVDFLRRYSPHIYHFRYHLWLAF